MCVLWRAIESKRWFVECVVIITVQSNAKRSSIERYLEIAKKEQQLALHHTAALLLFRCARSYHGITEQSFTLVTVLLPSITILTPTIPFVFTQRNNANFKRGRWIQFPNLRCRLTALHHFHYSTHERLLTLWQSLHPSCKTSLHITMYPLASIRLADAV